MQKELFEFGAYYDKSADVKEPILWRALDRDGDYTFAVTEFCIDKKPYNNDFSTTSWEECSLRSWLNNEFYNLAFSEEEKARIKTTTVPTSFNPSTFMSSGDPTEDKIFLLSLEDVLGGLFNGDEDAIAKPTEYAISQGVVELDGGACYWWLRTPGAPNAALVVEEDGQMRSLGKPVTGAFLMDFGICVRPAMWVMVN